MRQDTWNIDYGPFRGFYRDRENGWMLLAEGGVQRGEADEVRELAAATPIGEALRAGGDERKKQKVVAVIGDGGFQMTIQELGTMAQHNARVKIVLLNNNFLGMVRQWQQLFFQQLLIFSQKNLFQYKVCRYPS